MKTKLLWGTALAALLAMATITLAQTPSANIDPRRHPNLAAAQKHIIEAFQEAEAAQARDHDELGGHAEKAKDLLRQADHELKEAERYYQEHHH